MDQKKGRNQLCHIYRKFSRSKISRSFSQLNEIMTLSSHWSHSRRILFHVEFIRRCTTSILPSDAPVFNILFSVCNNFKTLHRYWVKLVICWPVDRVLSLTLVNCWLHQYINNVWSTKNSFLAAFLLNGLTDLVGWFKLWELAALFVLYRRWIRRVVQFAGTHFLSLF